MRAYPAEVSELAEVGGKGCLPLCAAWETAPQPQCESSRVLGVTSVVCEPRESRREALGGHREEGARMHIPRCQGHTRQSPKRVQSAGGGRGGRSRGSRLALCLPLSLVPSPNARRQGLQCPRYLGVARGPSARTSAPSSAERAWDALNFGPAGLAEGGM